MIGYYVHHHGLGHLHRCLRLTAELRARGEQVSVLSSLPAPPDPDGTGPAWVQLPRDDDGEIRDPDAHGLLHWAPLGHDGFRARQAAISAWIEDARPDAVVCDVSQEVAVLCRLHGVPVVSVTLPGRRGDPAHLLGFALSTRLVGFWPPEADRMLRGLPPELAQRVEAVGALSRFEPAADTADAAGPGDPHAVVLSGRGGAAWAEQELAAFAASAPGWRLQVLGGAAWHDDPWPVLRSARVVIAHAGQNAVAEVAAARVPALVVPAVRPFAEQVTTAEQLSDEAYPALIARRLPGVGGADLLERVAALDARRWSRWCDGGAAARFADVVAGAAEAAR